MYQVRVTKWDSEIEKYRSFVQYEHNHDQFSEAVADFYSKLGHFSSVLYAETYYPDEHEIPHIRFTQLDERTYLARVFTLQGPSVSYDVLMRELKEA